MGKYDYKYSGLEKRINKILGLNFIVLVCLALAMAIGNYFFALAMSCEHNYIFEGGNIKEMAISAFFSFVIILNTILPLDLVVGLEFIYLCIRYFIEKDWMMSCVDTDINEIVNCRV